jgi:hypothetical protein
MLPFLKKRGRTFFCPARHHGLIKADQCETDGYWPYGLNTCYYDTLPDDHDFYGFAAMLARFQEDFLAGSTPTLRENEINDVEKAAHRAALCLQHGLRAGFFGEMVTHEQRFKVLALDEWDRILTRTAQLMAPFETIPSSHGAIGPYLKARDRLRLAEVKTDGTALRGTLTGTIDVPLRLSVFRNTDEGISREYKTIQPFDGKATIA